MPAKRADLRQAILDQAGRGAADKRSAAPEEDASGRATPRARPGRAGKVSITGYFAPAVRRQLKRLAVDADTTVQALLGEALNDLFAKRGLPEIAESDS